MLETERLFVVPPGTQAPSVSGGALGGAALDQYDKAALARHIGWLPQEVVLLSGTVAENIARLDAMPDAEAVVKSARQAGVHAR